MPAIQNVSGPSVAAQDDSSTHTHTCTVTTAASAQMWLHSVVTILFCLKSPLPFFHLLLCFLGFPSTVDSHCLQGVQTHSYFIFNRDHTPSSSAESICIDDMSYVVFTLSVQLDLNLSFEQVKHLSDKQMDVKAKWQKDERTRCRLFHSSCRYELPDQSIISAGLSDGR